MTCEDVERDELAEQYVLGRLDERREDAFEDHYFSCAVCLDRVRALQDAREELSGRGAGVGRRPWLRAVGVLAAAAVIVLAVRVGRDMGRDTPPAGPPSTPPADAVVSAPPLRIVIELPPYEPPRLRATPTEAQRVFRDAMVAYVAGNCVGAMPGLQRAVTIDASFMQARFYLAACELHEGRTDAGEANLRRVIGAGESPYLEDAYFLLAQARMQKGDVEGARQELNRVLSLNGDRASEAKRLLEEVEGKP